MICMHDMYAWFAFVFTFRQPESGKTPIYRYICFDSFGPGSAASGRATGGSIEPAVDVLPHISLHGMTFWYHFSPNPIFSMFNVRKIRSRSSWYLYGSATRVRIGRLLCFTERRIVTRMMPGRAGCLSNTQHLRIHADTCWWKCFKHYTWRQCWEVVRHAGASHHFGKKYQLA